MFPLRDNIPSRTTPVVNYLLILVCSLVFLVQLSAEYATDHRADLTEQFGMIPQRVLHPNRKIVIDVERPVMTPFGIDYVETHHRVPPPPINPWLTLLTCLFLHGGWLHVIGNMWFLFIFGDNVEDRLGHARYLLFYLACGLAGSFAHLIANYDSSMPTIGASGAIAGVMGGYFILYPRAKVLTLVPIFIFITLFDIPAPIFLGFWFLLQFLQGLVPSAAETGGVAWWAHIGGFAAGMGLVFWLREARITRPAVPYTLPLPRRRWQN